MTEYFIAVDVGSYSVRSGLFLKNKSLTLIEKVEIKIDVYSDEENFYEQSSKNIWEQICVATKDLISKSSININLVKGISFDATCSLVALDHNGCPLSVSKTGDNNRNIIMWMDHRATEETIFINERGHKTLKTFGGKISVEMQPPKLLWLKKHFPQFMALNPLLFDLPDYLTFRATGSMIRSLCSVTCKWAFDAENSYWDKSFWESINLSEICYDNFSKIGNTFCLPGIPINCGLTDEAAKSLGLLPGIKVPGSLIDAYAGMLGAISDQDQIITIAGTSVCHMVLTSTPVYIDGVWGPFKDVLMKNYYVLEAGQSAAGILLDRILQFASESITHEDVLENLLQAVGEKHFNYSTIQNFPSDKWYQLNSLVKDIHVNPDFLGNRSPRSDMNARGSIVGLSLDNSALYVSKIYLSAIHGLAYGFKEIIEKLIEHSVPIKSIKLCGGLSKNILYTKVLADVCGFPVTIFPEDDLVLKGTAMLNFMRDTIIFESDVVNKGFAINPDLSLVKFHKDKFNIFLKIVKFQACLQGDS